MFVAIRVSYNNGNMLEQYCKTLLDINSNMVKKNIVRIAKRCPENITLVVKYVKLLFLIL